MNTKPIFVSTIKKKIKMNYSTYILTTFETEIEKEFSSKKDMMNYLSSELFVTKEMNSICVLTFSLDNEGYKTSVKTKYTFDNRF
jgi:hypothetical protein